MLKLISHHETYLLPFAFKKQQCLKRFYPLFLCQLTQICTTTFAKQRRSREYSFAKTNHFTNLIIHGCQPNMLYIVTIFADNLVIAYYVTPTYKVQMYTDTQKSFYPDQLNCIKH